MTCGVSFADSFQPMPTLRCSARQLGILAVGFVIHAVDSNRHGTYGGTGPLCDKHGFRQQSATRTRGQWPWNRVWRVHMCVECCQPGAFALRATTPDGRRIISADTVSVWLCKRCYEAVHAMRTQGERTQFGLPRVRAGRGLMAASHWHWLLQQIPVKKKASVIKKKARLNPQ
eukprot:COSAG02_NODE_8466_length_2563_cov_1.844156_2_plen_173_part_00